MGTGESASNRRVLPARTTCVPGAHSTGPFTCRPSISPVASNPTVSATSSFASVRTFTVVSAGNSGAAGRSNVRASDMKTDATTIAGTASAVSLSQYWNACTNVIDRMPPPTTVSSTRTPAAAIPLHAGSAVSVVRASPAPCSWGSR